MDCSETYKTSVHRRPPCCLSCPLSLSHISKDAGVKWRGGSRPETHSGPTQPAARHCNSSVWSPAKDPGRRGQGRAAAALTHHDDPQAAEARPPSDSDSRRLGLRLGSSGESACVRARARVCMRVLMGRTTVIIGELEGHWHGGEHARSTLKIMGCRRGAVPTVASVAGRRCTRSFL
jgi:hypothetical protein